MLYLFDSSSTIYTAQSLIMAGSIRLIGQIGTDQRRDRPTRIHFKLEATKYLHVIPVIEIPRVAQVTHIDRDIENEPSRPQEVRGGHHS